MPNRRMLQFAWLLLCVLCSAISAIAGNAAQSDSPFHRGLVERPEKSSRKRCHFRDPNARRLSLAREPTLNGLVRFDGNHFTVFDENNTLGLDSDQIVFLFEDNETNLWVGTESAGLAVIKNGIVKNFGVEGASCGKMIYAAEDSQSNIVFYATAGLLNYHNGKMDFNPGVTSPQLFDFAAKILVPSKSGGIWQIINGTVQKWRNGQLEKDFGASPWGNTNVTSACEDENGNLIVGTLGAGVFWYDASGKFQQVSTNQGLSSTYVLSLCFDREGNLWAGTDGGGLNRIKRKTFNAPAGFPPRNVQSLSQDDHGGWWIASGAPGVSYWNTNAVQDFHVGPLHDAWEVLVDRRQQNCVGKRDEGLNQFQTKHFVHAPGAEILGAQISALFEDRSGQLWAGTQNGLANFDGQKWKLFTTRDGLSENEVRAIAQDTDGNFWIGTENTGLNFFKDGKFISYRAQENGLTGNEISCL